MARDPVDVVRTIEGIWNDGKLDELDDYFAPNFNNSASGVSMLPPGLEGAKMAHQMSMQAFPDRRTEIIDIFGSGDKVCVEVRCTGTNEGGVPWLGAPANGAKVDFRWMSVYEVKDGQITKHTGVIDTLTLLMQLGVVQPPM